MYVVQTTRRQFIIQKSKFLRTSRSSWVINNDASHIWLLKWWYNICRNVTWELLPISAREVDKNRLLFIFVSMKYVKFFMNRSAVLERLKWNFISNSNALFTCHSDVFFYYQILREPFWPKTWTVQIFSRWIFLKLFLTWTNYKTPNKQKKFFYLPKPFSISSFLYQPVFSVGQLWVRNCYLCIFISSCTTI